MRGGWRDVLEFDASDQEKTDDIMTCAEHLFQEIDGCKLRIIVLGQTAPLMNWTYANGWREWRTGAAA
jgi:hypothetical protein